jgi:DedD protein
VAQAHDDGFHEIQLSGKQLAFLVMAATVVSVVIFLFGVLVGRGVRTERSAMDTTAAATALEPAPAPAASSPAPTAGEDPTKAVEAPVPPAGDSETVVPDRAALERTPKNAEVKEAPKPAVKELPKPAASKPVEKTTTATDTKAPAEPGGSGYAVQIAALNVRSEADAIAKRLTSKGYSAYVLAPASGSPSVFRVRVGKFQTRREAENVAARLQKEEQFRPWVTR